MAAVTVRCAGCGKQWDVAPKPDGSMPVNARCPKDRGGCGKVKKVPRQQHAASPAAAAVTTGWDPPSVPRGPRRTAEQCPKCGERDLLASPRSTVRACPSCKLVTPPGVRAPYRRGTGGTREARSQRERDDDAKKTVILAGEFLRRVEALAADPKIHPASADLLGWYAEEIAAARKERNGPRLAELAAEFDADRDAGHFRRRHWWQGEPAALTAGDDDGEDDEYDDGQVVGPAPDALATPASIAAQQQRAQPQRATWADAFAARGWRLAPGRGDSACQVTEHGGARCAEQIGGHPPVSDGLTRDGWACSGHYYALAEAANSINRARGIT